MAGEDNSKPYDLSGKCAVITGASSGIGAAMARELDAAGMKSLLVARSEDKLASLAEDLSHAETLSADVTKDGAAQAIVAAAKDKLGGFHVLLNNAGMMQMGDVDEIDIDKAMAMVRLNVEAAFRIGLLAARHFKAQKEGYLVNTSSVAGISPMAGLAVYNGAKAAIEAFTDALRLELGECKVRVGCIEPGTTDTGLFEDWDDDKQDYIASAGALSPEDIARSVRFMLEQPAAMTIGRILAVPTGSPA